MEGLGKWGESLSVLKAGGFTQLRSDQSLPEKLMLSPRADSALIATRHPDTPWPAQAPAFCPRAALDQAIANETIC